MVQGKEDTGDSGCAAEVHHGRVGEESSGGVQLSHGARFLWTAHLDANDIAVRPEHFVLVQEEVDVENVQAMRPTTLVLHVLLELQNEALFELLSEYRNAVAVDLLPLGCKGIPDTFVQRKYLFRTQSHSRTTPSKKKSSDAVRTLSP